jgi:hypothetical protein
MQHLTFLQSAFKFFTSMTIDNQNHAGTQYAVASLLSTISTVEDEGIVVSGETVLSVELSVAGGTNGEETVVLESGAGAKKTCMAQGYFETPSF